MRADAMLEAGDMGGYAVWKRILRAVEELQKTGPGVWPAARRYVDSNPRFFAHSQELWPIHAGNEGVVVGDGLHLHGIGGFIFRFALYSHEHRLILPWLLPAQSRQEPWFRENFLARDYVFTGLPRWPVTATRDAADPKVKKAWTALPLASTGRSRPGASSGKDPGNLKEHYSIE